MARLVSSVAAVVCVLATAGAVSGATSDHLIVFPALAEGGSAAQLFSIEPSGANLKQLTTGTYSALNPAFSPAGTRIAFARFGVGIFTINADGSHLRRLTTNGRDAYPTWSPNGKTIAFIRPLGLAWRLFVVPSSGGKPHRLKQAPAAGRPNWTKKGLLVPTSADLIRVDPKTGRVLKYYDASIDAIWGLHSVAISPGVSKLTYIGTRDPIPGDQDCGDGPCQRYGLFLENLQGKSRRPRMIVKDAGPATFSPDGSRVAYVAGGALVLQSLTTGLATPIPLAAATPQPQGSPAWR